MADSVVHATDSSFQSDVLDSDVPVLVDFWAEWCGPCRAIAPHVESIASEFEGKARVVKVDIDANPKTAASYGVRSIPTLLLFKGGEVVDHLVGNPGSAKPLQDMVARNV
jgi:thioredoxin 1